MAIINVTKLPFQLSGMHIMRKQPLKNQQGVVLVVSLVFLIALTAIASVLMLNTTADMKMSGSSQTKVRATQEAISAIDEIVYTQIEGGGNNTFTASQFPEDMTAIADPSATDEKDISARICTIDRTVDCNTKVVRSETSLVVDCPHSKLASSNQVFKCNVLRVIATNKYGKLKTSQVQVNAGIAQELLNIGG